MKIVLKKVLVALLRFGIGVARRLGLSPVLRTAVAQGLGDEGFLIVHPPFSSAIQELVTTARDPVRYTVLALALERIRREKIQGNLAEAGVWQGYTSRIIHTIVPDTPLYLFDTFEGFKLSAHEDADDRFKDTSVEMLTEALGDLHNVVIRKGFFPDTAKGLESEQFAFVLLDLDKYEPTMDGLKFFYPRMPRGGYIFVHDYNSPESQYGVSRAVNEFMSGKPENIIEVPDLFGSIMIRKA